MAQKTKTAEPQVGNRYPRIKKVPKGKSPDGDFAIELGREYGIDLFKWQQDAVRYALIRDKNGNFASLSFCLSIPRQNGKTEIIVVIILYFLLILGLRVLYTAHLGETCFEVYDRVARIFEENDDLAEISQVKRSNGKECVKCKIVDEDGTVTYSKVQFRTRSKNAGRGISKVNLLIYDEAQTLTDTQASDIDALQFATGEDLSLTIYAGTPPKPDELGDVFEKIRKSVIDGTASDEIAYLEWSVEEEKDPHEEKW